MKTLPPRDERGRIRRWRISERPERVVLELRPVWIRPGGLTGDPDSIVAVFEPVDPDSPSRVSSADGGCAMADNGRLDTIEDAVRALVQAQAEDRERWKQSEERWKQSEERWKQNEERWTEYQRTSLQMMGLLVELGKEVGDHGRLLERITERLDRHDAMLDRIDGSLDATLKALHRLLEGR